MSMAIPPAPTRTIVIRVSVLLHRSRKLSRPEMLPRVMSRSMVLLQLGSVLMPVAYVTSEGNRNHA